MDYAGNSNKDKMAPPPDKQIEKVVTGEVIQKPKSFGQKFKGIFFAEDGKSVLRYVAADVVLPAMRNLMLDMTYKGMERMLMGGSSMARRRTPSYGSRVQYNNPVRRDRPYLPDQGPSRIRQVRRETNDYVLASKEEAETVIERMIDIVDKYQVASVADLHDLMGLPHSHTDNKWGWSYLNNTEIRQVRDGFLLELPSPEEI